ncbi:hypothetical protein VTN00DRAFT_6552 [Thermoascus crustaceus]|uniref:uncharacterized protein n=1 Tax=Thermoascus crustaceus TaxID=5088 RepID=UPI003742DC4D
MSHPTPNTTTYPLSKYAVASLTNIISCLDAGTLVPVTAPGENFVNEVDKLRTSCNYAAVIEAGGEDFIPVLYGIYNVLELATKTRDEEGIVPLAREAEDVLIQATATAGTMRRFPPKEAEQPHEAQDEKGVVGEDAQAEADTEVKDETQTQPQRARPKPKRIGKGKLRAKMLWRDA